jgi:polyhydroxyalkanoate synthase subunit PhaC
VPALVPTPGRAYAAARNVTERVRRGGLADLTPTPSVVLEEAPQRRLQRYEPTADDPDPHGLPVLLVPPLAAPSDCFDLRRGCSLAEHLVDLGHPTYLVDYGEIGFSDRALGLEHWVRDVLPAAVRRVSADAEGRPVQLVGWSLGGIMALLTAAAGAEELPIASVAMVGSPFDFRQVRLLAPFRVVGGLGDGVIGTALYRALGTAPAPLVRTAFELTAIDRRITRPAFVLANLHDRDWLAHQEAVDHYMTRMLAYPGRSFGQLYHRFFRVNEMVSGSLLLDSEPIRLADVRVPVLSVAGMDDVLAPWAAVHAVGDLLPDVPALRRTSAPGGHLGVLTGRSARGTTWRHLDLHLHETTRAVGAGSPAPL